MTNFSIVRHMKTTSLQQWKERCSIAAANQKAAKAIAAEQPGVSATLLKKANRQRMLCTSMIALENARKDGKINIFQYWLQKRDTRKMYAGCEPIEPFKL